jgi:hypothetical protein
VPGDERGTLTREILGYSDGLVSVTAIVTDYKVNRFGGHTPRR